MIWKGASLVDDCGERTLATYTEGTLRIVRPSEHSSIAVAYSAGARRWAATGTAGHGDTTEHFRLSMQGWTVSTLHAQCGTRSYALKRTGRLSKQRNIIAAGGVVVGRTRPAGATDLVANISDDMPFSDAVFLTWALTLIDTPARRTVR